MAKIVYFLGAGASAKALPVVNEFRIFIKYFLNFGKKLGIGEDATKYIEEILEDMRYYPSPDTLARKLELSDENEKLKRLNNLIGLMFAWKENVDTFGFRSEIPQEDISILEKSTIPLDPRYIAFFSALLESSKNKVLNKDIGIISWNYDSQIEKALSLLGAAVLGEEQYLKLNGSATIEYEGNFLGKDTIDIRDFINKINIINSSINYAWDNKDDKIELVGNIIKDTIKIIIIGYSFPVYNRYLDNAIFTLLSGYNEHKPLKIEIVGASETRLSEYENSIRAMLEAGNWFEIDKPRQSGELQRGFIIKKSLSPGQFPIPLDVPIFGQKTPAPYV